MTKINRNLLLFGLALFLIGTVLFFSAPDTGGEWINYSGGVHVYESNPPHILFYAGIVVMILGGICVKGSVERNEESKQRTEIGGPEQP
jgi:uncharacterized membrane protein